MKDLSQIDISPAEPPPFSPAYAAAVMLASERKGAVVEYPAIAGWQRANTPHEWTWGSSPLRTGVIYRIQPGSIIGSKEWFEKLAMRTRFRNSNLNINTYYEKTSKYEITTSGGNLLQWSQLCERDDWQILPAVESAPVEPVKGSREWCKMQPIGTKLWCARMKPHEFCIRTHVVTNPTAEAYTWTDGVSTRISPLGETDSRWHIVGTAEWAEALSEGTKLTDPTRDSGWFAYRKGVKWYSGNVAWSGPCLLDANPFATTSGNDLNIVQLYTEPPIPTAPAPWAAWAGMIEARLRKLEGAK